MSLDSRHMIAVLSHNDGTVLDPKRPTDWAYRHARGKRAESQPADNITHISRFRAPPPKKFGKARCYSVKRNTMRDHLFGGGAEAAGEEVQEWKLHRKGHGVYHLDGDEDHVGRIQKHEPEAHSYVEAHRPHVSRRKQSQDYDLFADHFKGHASGMVVEGPAFTSAFGVTPRGHEARELRTRHAEAAKRVKTRSMTHAAGVRTVGRSPPPPPDLS